jgi:eukaryotic-like serine/threonine-protein kinase
VEAPPPTSRTPTSREVRVAFDVDLSSHEFEVARRDEGSGLVRAAEEAEDDGLAPSPGFSRNVWLAGGIFLSALALCFLLVWLLG